MISQLLPHGVLTYLREVGLCRVLAGADALPARELIVGEFLQLERHCKKKNTKVHTWLLQSLELLYRFALQKLLHTISRCVFI